MGDARKRQLVGVGVSQSATIVVRSQCFSAVEVNIRALGDLVNRYRGNVS